MSERYKPEFEKSNKAKEGVETEFVKTKLPDVSVPLPIGLPEQDAEKGEINTRFKVEKVRQSIQGGGELIVEYVREGIVAGKMIVDPKEPIYISAEEDRRHPGFSGDRRRFGYRSADWNRDVIARRAAEALIELEGNFEQNVLATRSALPEVMACRLIKEITNKRPDLFAKLGRAIGWKKVLDEIGWSMINKDEKGEPLLLTSGDLASFVIRRDKSGEWAQLVYEQGGGMLERANRQQLPKPFTQELLDEIFVK